MPNPIEIKQLKSKQGIETILPIEILQTLRNAKSNWN